MIAKLKKLPNKASQFLGILACVLFLGLYSLFYTSRTSTMIPLVKSNIFRAADMGMHSMNFMDRMSTKNRTEIPSRYGQPFPGTDFLVYFNAVPKTGSRGLDVTVRQLAERKHSSLQAYNFPPELAADIPGFNHLTANLERGTFMRGHWRFREFPRENKIAYINIVRDPIERLLSNYYFDLNGDLYGQWVNDGVGSPPTIDECIWSSNDYCFRKVYSYYKQVTLERFCGTQWNCSQVTNWTLQQAKKNVERYTLVGLTEQYEDTVRMMEVLFPDLFQGIAEVFIQNKGLTLKFKTKGKKKPSKKTHEFLQADLRLEYEFYEFIQQRFTDLKKTLLLDAETQNV